MGTGTSCRQRLPYERRLCVRSATTRSNGDKSTKKRSNSAPTEPEYRRRKIAFVTVYTSQVQVTLFFIRNKKNSRDL
jgi:hypothetical protein